MQKRLIIDSRLLDITIDRLCQHLIEVHEDFSNTVIIGLQPRGIYLADIIHAKLEKELNTTLKLGYLDTTFHRDDFRRRDKPVRANETKINFVIEGKQVVLIDDVLYTGRSTRAALDAMMAFGRPEKVDLLVLVNRKYSRDLPIEPDFVGTHVNTIASEKVLVQWKAQGFKKNRIWLVEKLENE